MRSRWMLRGRRRRMLPRCRYGARSLHSRGAARKRHQRDVPGALNGHAEPPLMPRANSRHAARQNFAAFLHELRQDVGALVVDEIHLLYAKLADLLLAKILPFAATRTAGTPTGACSLTARTSVAAWTAFSTPGARRCGSLRWFLFLCHACLPFNEARFFSAKQPAKARGRYVHHLTELALQR